MKKRIHVFIAGRVQGVAFRDYTKKTADTLGLTGWVKNNRDGRVEAIFEGGSPAIEAMSVWCHKGSPFARVEEVVIKEEPFTGVFPDFRITY
ncbi:MAG: acylphosphatase [Syntrophales bacterium]|nr:acylphosphatase [Syntrophales bacterium]